ncbi:MAG: hypothetical protein COB93_09535 [Sneathiella sp.]|nr:MAG: hypothetical protein COB93_09535 [Sneathiella sp.]
MTWITTIGYEEANSGLKELYDSNAENALPAWKRDVIGLYVSILNACDHDARQQFKKLRAHTADEQQANNILSALETGRPEQVFTGSDLAMLLYTNLLTTRPSQIDENMIDEMRGTGLEDSEILEINQAVAYFSYSNRTILGLGIIEENHIPECAAR